MSMKKISEAILGVGVDEDGVEVVHLDVSLEAYLLFAAEGAARRGGKGVHPLPAAFQLRPGRRRPRERQS